MRLVSVTVGGTVVGSFSSTRHKNFAACIRSIAPGCNVVVKKSHYTPGIVTQKHPSRTARERQQTKTNKIGSYERITLLKPGEFKL